MCVFVYKEVIFNIVITPFRDMSDISALKRVVKGSLNLKLEPQDRSQGTWCRDDRSGLSVPGCLNGDAAK